MRLQNGHIILPNDVVKTVLEGELQVSLVFYPERSTLLVAGKSKAFFEKLHKTEWMALKDKNAQGDKSLFVRALLIDHNLDETDRDLEYEIKSVGILSIQL
jgi:hypothetical protein